LRKLVPTAYQIIEELAEKIRFSFDAHFTSLQVTTMFTIQYTGDHTEINGILFVQNKHILDYLAHEETQAFYKRNFL